VQVQYRAGIPRYCPAKGTARPPSPAPPLAPALGLDLILRRDERGQLDVVLVDVVVKVELHGAAGEVR
jgi:hypothetical protein